MILRLAAREAFDELSAWIGHANMKAIGWVGALLALLSGVSCVGRSCDASLRLNPTTVHESDITLSQPATTADARLCLDTVCRSTSLDTTNSGQKSCIVEFVI